ncbi:MAG TPA: nuclear transport factor 2 family protein [Verrucomicrobiae bacterium]|jgi:ketosteroid isomerase-like protein
MNNSVQAAAAQFYQALNILFTGDAEPMKQVWSHAEDITFLGPAGEFHVGWSQIQKDWEMTAALKLGGKVEAVDIRVFTGQDIAITQNYEKGENKDRDGKAVSVSIRATNIFRKEAGEWKMISHQTDLLPYLMA